MLVKCRGGGPTSLGTGVPARGGLWARGQVSAAEINTIC